MQEGFQLLGEGLINFDDIHGTNRGEPQLDFFSIKDHNGTSYGVSQVDLMLNVGDHSCTHQ